MQFEINDDSILAIKNYAKMCEYEQKFSCVNCPLDERNNQSGITCIQFMAEYPEEAVEIIVDYTTG